MIIVVGGIKGGSGKTTIATNLTVMRSATHKVLLIDADEQRSASDWADQREALGIKTNWSTIQLSGKSIHAQIKRLHPDYDDIIIDVGGRDTTSQRAALSIADIFLIPFKPRSLDVWTIGPVNTMISEIRAVNPNLQCYAVINQADAQGEDNKSSMEVIQECKDIEMLNSIIGQRKAFCNAASEGLGISEMKIVDKKAKAEMDFLYKSLFNLSAKCV